MGTQEDLRVKDNPDTTVLTREITAVKQSIFMMHLHVIHCVMRMVSVSSGSRVIFTCFL